MQSATTLNGVDVGSPRCQRSSRMNSVVYLTGAPATGKSSLSRSLKSLRADLHVFAYSEELRRMVSARTGTPLAEDDIRSQSAAIVTSEDVAALDARLITMVNAERGKYPILIAVTRLGAVFPGSGL